MTNLRLFAEVLFDLKQICYLQSCQYAICSHVIFWEGKAIYRIVVLDLSDYIGDFVYGRFIIIRYMTWHYFMIFLYYREIAWRILEYDLYS